MISSDFKEAKSTVWDSVSAVPSRVKDFLDDHPSLKYAMAIIAGAFLTAAGAATIVGSITLFAAASPAAFSPAVFLCAVGIILSVTALAYDICLAKRMVEKF